MVEDAIMVGRDLGDVKRAERTVGLQEAEKGKDSIEDAFFRIGGDDNACFTIEGDIADGEPFFTEAGKRIVTGQLRNDIGVGGSAHDEAPVAEPAGFAMDLTRDGSQKALQAKGKLLLGGVRAIELEGADRFTVVLQQLRIPD